MNNLFNGLDTTSKIRGVLAARELTQADLATILGVTPETISNRMKSKKWDINDLHKIASEYGLEVSDLI